MGEVPQTPPRPFLTFEQLEQLARPGESARREAHWARRPDWATDRETWDRSVREVCELLGEPVPESAGIRAADYEEIERQKYTGTIGGIAPAPTSSSGTPVLR